MPAKVTAERRDSRGQAWLTGLDTMGWQADELAHSIVDSARVGDGLGYAGRSQVLRTATQRV